MLLCTKWIITREQIKIYQGVLSKRINYIELYLSLIHIFSPSEKEAIGVVFWCNDGNNPNIKETAYAVSLEDLEENPLIDTDEDIANVSEDENSFDGAANTAAIMNFAIKDSLAYPAAQKAIEYAPKGVTAVSDTHLESKPISINPFRITEEEYNVEKKNFLKSLIFLIWKGANGEVKKQEEEIMDSTIEKY